VLLTSMSGLAACDRRPGFSPVSSIRVRATELAPALAEAGIDARVTVDAARKALAAAGFDYDEGSRRAYRADVEVIAFSVVTDADGATPAAEVVLELRLEPSWAAGPPTRQAGRARSRLTGAQREGAWREALRIALGEAAKALALDVRASQKSTEALVADLSEGDPRARERAVRALAARGARGAIKPLAERVRDPDPVVSGAAVEALAALRDPSSAVALIEAAQAGDAGATLRLLPVLVEIGGPDVEGYLLTLASGHADRAVRRAAEEALPRIRGGGGAPVGPAKR
jgi:hypothetical protein